MLDPSEVEADVLENMKVIEPTYVLQAELDLKAELVKLSNSDKSSTGGVTSHCKLPKLELPLFKGNALEWQGFWDQFNVSIHLNEMLSDIDRFNYLKRYLSGSALSTVSGLSLNSQNYKKAITLLTERYGNPQVLLTAHMRNLC